MFVEARIGVDWEDTAVKQKWIHSNEERQELKQLYNQIFKDEVSTKELQQAKEVLQKSIRQWPHNPIFRNYLYNVYLLMEDPKSILYIKSPITQYFFGAI